MLPARRMQTGRSAVHGRIFPAGMAHMKLIKEYGGGWWAEQDGQFMPLNGFVFDMWLAERDPPGALRRWWAGMATRFSSGPRETGAPVDSQEIWAAGVTYLRSREARITESPMGAGAYDRVYDAPRPELFFKATARRCAGSGGLIVRRDDSRWTVPEPELALVISSHRRIAGFTIGNDVSCRDIEGENLLYLPQAKIWDGCCALGPAILINDGSADPAKWVIEMEIRRDGQTVFSGCAPFSRMKRQMDELVDWLFRNQSFPAGVVLLTGTGIVPPDDFSLRSGDEVAITVAEIGTLVNRVR